jgi:predicted nucleic acid-binding protein
VALIQVLDLLLDTNAYTAFKRGHPQTVEILRHVKTIGMSSVVLGELQAGFAAGKKEAENQQELNQFLANSRIVLLTIDDTTAKYYASIYKLLRNKGTPIPTNDMWIAATALQYGFALFTYDKHFANVDNLLHGQNLSDFLVKNGADKRRASREELFRLMQSSSRLSADEMDAGVGIALFDFFYFSEFYQTVYGETLDNINLSKEQLLNNFKLAKDKQLTLAGLLLFGTSVESLKPQFGIKGTRYFNDNEFLDKEDIGGKLPEQQKKGVDFILRNLRRRQINNDFNSPGELEIPMLAVKEAVANALVHRDYFINSSIFINIFPDRVEIASAGLLPNTLTVENIKLGIHIERNPIILSFMAKFPETGYTGRGSGIPRMLRLCQEKGVPLKLINDTDRNQFKVVFSRNQNE